MTIAGCATADGTRRFRSRLQATCANGHFREAGAWQLSSFGLGTYLGNPDAETDRLVEQAAVRSAQAGVNLLDCAINYRFEHAERSLGAAVARLACTGQAQRDELVVCTKGGFAPVADDPRGWFDATYVRDDRFQLKPDDLVAGCHCMHPRYLQDQIQRSLRNLDLETIDVYYLHNPETQLAPLGADGFYQRLLAAFETLEAARTEGWITAYGLATWNAFRVGPDHPEHLSLSRVKDLARQAAQGRDDGLCFVQLPLNMAMPEALLATQQSGSELVPVLEVARQNGIFLITSASICQARLLGRIPAPMAAKLGAQLHSDAQRALQFTRSTPGVTSALVGMKTPAHLDENLQLATVEPLSPQTFLQAIGQLE